MWVFILCAFSFSQGSLADVDCSKDAFDSCGNPELFSFIPQEIAVFKELCPQFTSNLKCLKTFQDNCPAEYGGIFETEELYEGIYSTFSDLCKEGTLLNSVASQNLKCLNETFSKTLCGEKVKEVTGPYRRPDKNSEDENDYSLPMELFCLESILESDCISVDIGENCGQAALEATMEFFRRSFFVEEFCGKQISEYLMKNVDEFNLDQQQKEFVIATLEKTQIFHTSRPHSSPEA